MLTLEIFSMFSIISLNEGPFIHEQVICIKCLKNQRGIICEAGEQEIFDIIGKFVLSVINWNLR